MTEKREQLDTHDCWCKFYRDNAGKWVLVEGPQSAHMKLLGDPPDCRDCDNTGRCT